MMDSTEIECLHRIATAVEQIAENTKQESVEEIAIREIKELKQIIRNFGMELQTNLDYPPGSGMEMAKRMRELAARMSTFGVPPELVRGDRKG